MLDIQNHHLAMKRILMDIYTHPQLQSQLVFKGGTCLYFFYKLNRFSVDLDFSLHREVDRQDVSLTDLSAIIRKNLNSVQESNKRYTWFWMGSFEKGKQKIKVEVSKHHYPDQYTEHEFYGLTVRSLDLPTMFAHKLCAITDRKQIANRDLFDAWWLLRQNVIISPEIIASRTDKTINEYLIEVKKYIEKHVHPKQMLSGLGELINEKQKVWVKEHLFDELMFELEQRIESVRE